MADLLDTPVTPPSITPKALIGVGAVVAAWFWLNGTGRFHSNPGRKTKRRSRKSRRHRR